MPASNVPSAVAAPVLSAAELDERMLSRLTGVRSGKQSYYAELKHTKARLTSAVQALERISEALARTRDDPRALLAEVLRAAAGHLRSGWTMIAVQDTALAGLTTRFLAAGPDGRVIEHEAELPGWLGGELASARQGSDTENAISTGSDAVTGTHLIRVPLALDGAILGRLVASHVPGVPVEHADLWVLRILANQAAVSMHIATRTAELARAEGRLQVLHDRELLDAERHRIALDLHDSVAQYVLSAGLAVDVCRAEAADRDDREAEQQLTRARDLIARAGDQVRSVVFALHHKEAGDEVAILPELLQSLAAQYRPGLDLAVRLEGRPCPLTAATAHGLARIAGEALFNIWLHAGASRAVIRLRYAPASVSLWISDDGGGDPIQLRRLLRLEARGDSDGRHQGLAGMARRAGGLGGSFAIRRANLGGIRIEVRIPAPASNHEGGTSHEASASHQGEST